MRIKICVAVVTNRQVRPNTVLSLMRMLAHTEHEVFPLIATEGYTIAENRNYVTYQALRNECTHILFIDDDMTFPEDTIEKLLDVDKPVVGVYSYSRVLPLSPTVAFIDDEGMIADTPEKRPDEPFKAYHVGFGVALVKIEVFEKLPTPWFKFAEAPNGKVIVGEDGYLCDQARGNGFEVWCEPRLQVGHLGEYNFIDEYAV